MNKEIEFAVDNMSPSEISSILMNEKNVDAILINEGGNMFSDVTRINQDNVAATLRYVYDEILPAIGLNRKFVQPLGSTGKKLSGGTSGDIDLGIDATKVDFLKDIEDVEEYPKALNDNCAEALDKLGIEYRMIPTLFSIKCPIQNFDGKQDGEFVQLDLMPTKNFKFQGWSLFAPKEVEGEQYIKGAIRNSILEAVAHAMDDKKVLKTGLVKFKDGVKEDMIEWEEYSYFIQEGLNIKRLERPLAKNEKLAQQGIHNAGEKLVVKNLVTNEPDVIAKKMFGPKVKGKDLMDWKGTWEAAKNAIWAKKNWSVFIDSLRSKLIQKMKAGCKVPQVILDEVGLEDMTEVNESKLSIVQEGGNRFSYVTRINQDNAKATMDDIKKNLMEFFKLKSDEIIFTGSTGKKLSGSSSGDVDCAISRSALKKNFDMETPEEYYDLCQDFAKHCKIEVDVLPEYGFDGIAFAYPIVNSDGKQENEFVQLDLIPDDNLKFRDWSQYAPAEKEGESYVKGLVRNQIMMAAAPLIDMKILDTGLVNKMDGEQPIAWKRYSYNHQNGGLLEKTFERPLMKGKKGEEGYHTSTAKETDRHLVTSDPDEICEILFKVDSQNMLTWQDAWSAVKKIGILKDTEKKQKFIDALKRGIEQAITYGNLPYLPPELEKFLDIDTKTLFGTKSKHNVDESIKSTKGMSALDTPREAMVKIHQLTGTQLRTFLQDFIDGVNNSSLMIKTTPKIDGYPFRVAWIDGKVCMELSYSGLLDKEGVESLTGKGVFKHERNFYDYVEENHKNKMFSFLKKVGIDGVKLIGELLANGDDFKDDNGTVTYVGTTYDADKLGSNGSLVIIDAKGMTKEKAFDLDDETKKKVIEFACSQLSDSSASYFDINQFAQQIEIDISDFPQEVVDGLRNVPPSKMKKEQADQMKMMINASMTEIMKKKFKNPDIMKADDGSLEGVAFELNGKLYGIHYQSWKDIRNGYFKDIDEMADFVKNFLADVTGQNAKIGFTKMLNMIRSEPEKYQDRYAELLPKYIERSQELISNANSRTDLPKFIDGISKSRAQMLPSKFDPTRLTTDVNSLIEVLSGEVIDKGGKTIALIPGSFRPPHKGHMDMVKHYANIADEVIVAISGQTNMASQRYDKFGRSMPNFLAGEIMEIYCDAMHLDNVKMAMVMNPIQWVKNYMRHSSNCKIMLGLSQKDDPSRFDQLVDEKFTSTLNNVEVLDVAKNAAPATQSNDENISATYLRDHIDDKNALRKVMPNELNDEQFEQVYELLNPNDGNYPSMNDQMRAKKFDKKLGIDTTAKR